MSATFKLTLAHLVGNGALLLLGYYWLGLGEPDAAHLAYSAAVALVIALCITWLHGTALALFGEASLFGAAALRALRHLAPLFAVAAAAAAIYALLSLAYDSFGHAAFTIGSYSTMTLRRPVAPDNVLKGFHFAIWILRWIVTPAMLLPLASRVARLGWPGWSKQAFAKSKSVVFWVEAAVILVAAVHLPVHLYLWTPKMPNFAMEAVSVALRLGLAYLLLTGGLLLLEFRTSAGRPSVTQFKTAPSP